LNLKVEKTSGSSDKKRCWQVFAIIVAPNQSKNGKYNAQVVKDI